MNPKTEELLFETMLLFVGSGFHGPNELVFPRNDYIRLCHDLGVEDPDGPLCALRVEPELRVDSLSEAVQFYAQAVRPPKELSFIGPKGIVRIRPSEALW